MNMPIDPATPIIEIKDLKNFLGGRWVHQGIDLDIYPKEIVAIVGGSGSGKSTLLRSLLMLQQPTAGTINIFGQNLKDCSGAKALWLRRRWGVMFQQGALFSSLTVLENVAFPLFEHTQLSRHIIYELALLKILLAGLPKDAANKYPAELSGGMLKRAAVARAIANDPELLFLDEPTAGLDPQGANALDEMILNLRNSLGLTIVLVTHDLDTLWHITDRVAFIGNGMVLGLGSMQELAKSEHPIIQNYFNGPRGRAAAQAQQENM